MGGGGGTIDRSIVVSMNVCVCQGSGGRAMYIPFISFFHQIFKFNFQFLAHILPVWSQNVSCVCVCVSWVGSHETRREHIQTFRLISFVLCAVLKLLYECIVSHAVRLLEAIDTSIMVCKQ